MRGFLRTLFLPLLLAAIAVPATSQKFTIPASGVQSFDFKDERNRNQAIFYSKAPLEDMTGTATGLDGTVTFDPANVAKTITGGVSVEVATIKTGITMRDEHMRGEKWLNAEKYPKISFKLSKLTGAKVKDNALTATAVGDFTLHGVTKQVSVPVTLTYMPESEKTKTRAPGDLLVLRAGGTLKLSDYGIQSEIIGQKVSDEIRWEFNAVGSNARK